MGFFENMVNDSRAKDGLKPLGEKAIPQIPVKKGPSIIKTSVHTEATPPLEDNEYKTLEHKDWQQTMKALTRLEEVYEWSEQQRPGLLEKLSDLEAKCLKASTSDHPSNYNHLKQSYLQMIGNLCEMYWVEHKKEPLDMVSIGLGMKKIRIYPSPTSPLEKAGPVAFYAKEIPALLATPKEGLRAILLTKETFPGAQIEYMK